MKQGLKVIVANENLEELAITKENLESKDIKIVGSAQNGEELESLILNQKDVDVVLMDVLLPKKDGFSILESAMQNKIKAKFVIVSALSSITFIQKAMTLGASYYMLKPVDYETVYNRIEDLFCDFSAKAENNLVAVEPKNKQLEEKITNIFITVGIPAHIKGYQFLREAVKMAIKNPDIINSITKELYPSIANHFDTSASKVERAIRHAIEVAWNRGKIENINNVFGIKIYSNNEKPTNGEFIALVADKMLLEG